MADKIGILIQARMGSTRLPGKVMMDIAGNPMVRFIVDRLRLIPDISLCAIVTSTSFEDDVLSDYLESEQIPLFRGDEHNVLDRYWKAANYFGLDHIIRVTADDPFVSFEHAQVVIQKHLKHRYDYTTNRSERGSGIPYECGIEVYRRDLLKHVWETADQPHHFEHVNEYIFEHWDAYRTHIEHVPEELRMPGLRLTVDTREDIQNIQNIMNTMGGSSKTPRLAEVIEFCKMKNLVHE